MSYERKNDKEKKKTNTNQKAKKKKKQKRKTTNKKNKTYPRNPTLVESGCRLFVGRKWSCRKRTKFRYWTEVRESLY